MPLAAGGPLVSLLPLLTPQRAFLLLPVSPLPSKVEKLMLGGGGGLLVSSFGSDLAEKAHQECSASGPGCKQGAAKCAVAPACPLLDRNRTHNRIPLLRGA